jgi:hypothetical protein
MRRAFQAAAAVAWSLCPAVVPAAEPATPNTAQDLVGLVIEAGVEGGASRNLRIEAVRDDPDSNGLLYIVADDATGEPICGRLADGTAVEALPLEGFWDTRMAWWPEGLTFACTDGILAKCVRWGYAPWTEMPGVDMRALHQTCTRMVRADYCGDGVPHTVEGTPIDIWDNAGINVRDNAAGMMFEAEWGPDGAKRIERTRYAHEMPYVLEHCPDRLAINGASGAGALIFNESFQR